MKNLSAFCLLSAIVLEASSQTGIGGIINDYAIVTAIDNGCGCPSTGCAIISVNSASGFSAGDRALIIQMKGATANTSNSALHGSLTNVYDAGNYEFVTIASVSSNDITTQYPLTETYFTGSSPADSACVQLVRVPVYAGNVSVESALTCEAWNGRTGGVLAFEVDGTLTLGANISVTGLGFKGARKQASAISCGVDTNFYYQSTIWHYPSCTSCGYLYDDSPTRHAGLASYGGCAPGNNPCYTNRMNSSDNRLAGYRGEGVVANTFIKTFANGNVAIFDKGKARWGTGGGGGGNHNGGGGGGGHYGSGGFGGNAFNVEGSGGCPAGTLPARRGYGGTTVTPTASKIFMGGGGGEGHDNGGQGTTGTAGGGIIFIKAGAISNSGSYTIAADGADNSTNSTNDGAGGGGAGGSILLDVSGSYANAVTISAKGGKGGDQLQSNCHGTGGGGGGGVIWFNSSSTPSNATTVVTGGVPGTHLNPSYDCADPNWNATAGASGAVMFGGSTPLFNENLCTILPVKLVSFSANVINDKVHLAWTTASETDNEYFLVERSSDAEVFTVLTRVDGSGTNHKLTSYTAIDEYPNDGSNYYRLKQTDITGHYEYSPIVQTVIETQRISWTLTPNPASDFLYASVTTARAQTCSIVILDLSGRPVMKDRIDAMAGYSTTLVDVSELPNGYYSALLSGRDGTLHRAFVKR